MKILVDMNLSPEWVVGFIAAGWESVHWSAVGNPAAPDSELMAWAEAHGFAVFTHDLDFGALLAATGAVAPSVIQLRSEDTRPSTMYGLVAASLRDQQGAVEEGALLTIDPRRWRVTILPLRGR